MHAHSALEPFERPALEPKVAQGFTTEVLHPDGLCPAPVAPDRWRERQAYLAAFEGPGPAVWPWSTLAEYLDALAATRPATTLVPSAGHNAIRDLVIGGDHRPASAEELAAMRAEVRTAVEAGARTLSFGMIYMPGVCAPTEELEALAVEAAAAGIPIVPHVRNEADGILESIEEFIGIAERTGAALHLSHLKLIGNADLLEPLLALLDAARERVDFTFDHYPYGAGSTTLSAILPPAAQAGGPAATLARLRAPQERAALAETMRRGLPGWENLYGSCGPDGIVIAHAGAPREDAIGLRLSELGGDPIEAAFDLLVDADLDVTMIDHYASEETVRALFRHPAGLVGSDGLFGEQPHPRLYGTAARVLGRLALRDGVIGVEEAIGRLATRAAQRLGLNDRGSVRERLRADLVLVDPEQLVDTATFADPRRTPPGVRRVIIGGRTAYVDGASTGERAGGVLTDAPVRVADRSGS
ncbi:MAG: hypothetical protein U0S48_23220 [Solirubrobacteraceae bacterium]